MPHKRGRWILPGILFLSFYLLLGARPMPGEYGFKPVGISKIDGSIAPVAGRLPEPADPLIPVRTPGRFAYVDPSGRILFSSDMHAGLALSPRAYALFAASAEGFTLAHPGSGVSFRIESAGYPFFSAGRLFVLHPDQSGVSEFDPGGRLLWSFEFPSIVTCHSANGRTAIFGLLDGRAMAVTGAGEIEFVLEPGGSRIDCIYGIAISGDSKRVALLSGLDRQRFLVYERTPSGMKEIHASGFLEGLTRPATLAFTGMDRHVFFERPEGVFICDTRSGVEHALATGRIVSGPVVLDGGAGFFLTLDESGEHRLVGVDETGCRIVSRPVRESHVELYAHEDSLYVTVGETLHRIDLERP